MSPRRRNRRTVGALLAVIAVMLSLTAASVPLYRLFCQVTGYGGTTQRATTAPAREVAGRLITVRFDATTAPDLDWEFHPLQLSVQVHPGEEKVIAYRAVNRSKEPLTGTATFNVTPAKAGIYFDKLQCFCFTRQHLAPGESANLSVSFFVDPDIASDPDTADVDTITLSYTMFRAKDEAASLRSSALERISVRWNRRLSIVIPAKAGIQGPHNRRLPWVPAFAGTTVNGSIFSKSALDVPTPPTN